MNDSGGGGLCGCLVWGVVLFFLANYVFIGWAGLFWLICWFFPPLILWPILEVML